MDCALTQVNNEAVVKRDESPFYFTAEIDGCKYKYNLLVGVNLIGRLEDSDIVIRKPEISRSHAFVEITKELDAFICDNGTNNGTFRKNTKLRAKLFYEIFPEMEINLANSVTLTLHIVDGINVPPPQRRAIMNTSSNSTQDVISESDEDSYKLENQSCVGFGVTKIGKTYEKVADFSRSRIESSLNLNDSESPPPSRYKPKMSSTPIVKKENNRFHCPNFSDESPSQRSREKSSDDDISFNDDQQRRGSSVNPLVNISDIIKESDLLDNSPSRTYNESLNSSNNRLNVTEILNGTSETNKVSEKQTPKEAKKIFISDTETSEQSGSATFPHQIQIVPETELLEQHVSSVNQKMSSEDRYVNIVYETELYEQDQGDITNKKFSSSVAKPPNSSDPMDIDFPFDMNFSQIEELQPTISHQTSVSQIDTPLEGAAAILTMSESENRQNPNERATSNSQVEVVYDTEDSQHKSVNKVPINVPEIEYVNIVYDTEYPENTPIDPSTNITGNSNSVVHQLQTSMSSIDSDFNFDEDFSQRKEAGLSCATLAQNGDVVSAGDKELKSSVASEPKEPIPGTSDEPGVNMRSSMSSGTNDDIFTLEDSDDSVKTDCLNSAEVMVCGAVEMVNEVKSSPGINSADNNPEKDAPSKTGGMQSGNDRKVTFGKQVEEDVAEKRNNSEYMAYQTQTVGDNSRDAGPMDEFQDSFYEEATQKIDDPLVNADEMSRVRVVSSQAQQKVAQHEMDLYEARTQALSPETENHSEQVVEDTLPSVVIIDLSANNEEDLDEMAMKDHDNKVKKNVEKNKNLPRNHVELIDLLEDSDKENRNVIGNKKVRKPCKSKKKLSTKQNVKTTTAKRANKSTNEAIEVEEDGKDGSFVSQNHYLHRQSRKLALPEVVEQSAESGVQSENIVIFSQFESIRISVGQQVRKTRSSQRILNEQNEAKKSKEKPVEKNTKNPLKQNAAKQKRQSEKPKAPQKTLKKKKPDEPEKKPKKRKNSMENDQTTKRSRWSQRNISPAVPSTTQQPPLRYREAKDKCVIFTGIPNVEKYVAIVKRLGGRVTQNVVEASHLVTDKERRTMKFMSALTRGLPILSVDWLLMSQRGGCFVGSNSYMLERNSELQNRIRSAQSFQRSNGGILGHFKTIVLLCEHIEPRPDELRVLISLSGGVSVPVSDPSCLEVVRDPDATRLCLASEDDLRPESPLAPTISRLRELGVSLVRAAFIVDLVIDQNWPDIDGYLLP